MYSQTWAAAAGVSLQSSAGRHHLALTILLYHFLCFDQVEGMQLAGIEMLCRQLLQIERACKKDPKNPDYRGLEVMTQSRLLDGAATAGSGDFARFVAQEQQTEAFALKQQRLFAEETAKKTGKDEKTAK